MPDSTKNVEISKYWTFNQTGNIMVSSTVQEEKDLRDAVVVEFQKVSVLYDAISTAIARKKKTYKVVDKDVSLGLFDYEAISALMAQSGFFTLMHEEDRTFEKSSSSMSIDAAMISEMLVAFSGAGPVMDIAKNVIRTMGGKAQKLDVSESSTNKKVRIGHLLFVCEDCMGMPLINIQVISTSLDQLSWIVKTPCSSTEHAKITMEYKMETFMFIDPQYIAQFSHEFKTTTEFEDLIKKLTDYIPDISQ
jgi:hypothetical protein